jgi:hypothetical protein
MFETWRWAPLAVGRPTFLFVMPLTTTGCTSHAHRQRSSVPARHCVLLTDSLPLNTVHSASRQAGTSVIASVCDKLSAGSAVRVPLGVRVALRRKQAGRHLFSLRAHRR